MKKTVCILLTLLLLLTVCACTDDEEESAAAEQNNGDENIVELPDDFWGDDASDTGEPATEDGSQSSGGDVWTKFY